MKYPTHAELMELSPEERLKLLDDVWDTFGDDPASLPLTDEHRQVLDERLEAHERDPSSGSTWPEVRAQLQRRR
jgi:putative addiction module component (TIGR02574 family)